MRIHQHLMTIPGEIAGDVKAAKIVDIDGERLRWMVSVMVVDREHEDMASVSFQFLYWVTERVDTHWVS